MYIPNFSFLAQFGGELCEEKTQKTQKMKKPDPKPLLWGFEGSKIVLKSQNPKKAHLRLLLNVHTKFQLPTSIRRGVMRGTNLEKEKKNIKKILF